VLNRRAEVLANHLASMLPVNARVPDIGCGDGLIGHLVQRKRPDVAITSCSGNTSVEIDVVFTDPNGAGTTTQNLGRVSIASSGNGTAGFVASGVDSIRAKSGTTVQYQTSNFTAGVGCSPAPTYKVYPVLTQLN
jgi:hypothetical protein